MFFQVAKLTTYDSSDAPACQHKSDAGADQEAAGDPVSQPSHLAEPLAGRASERDSQGIADSARHQENCAQNQELRRDMHGLANELRQKCSIEEKCLRVDYS